MWECVWGSSFEVLLGICGLWFMVCGLRSDASPA